MNPQTPISNDIDGSTPLRAPLPDNQATNFVVADDGHQVTQQPVVDSSRSVAADSDAIESEWVEKTQHILQSYVGDPYMLSEELEKLKINYIKQRYGKVVKSNSGQGA